MKIIWAILGNCLKLNFILLRLHALIVSRYIHLLRLKVHMDGILGLQRNVVKLPNAIFSQIFLSIRTSPIR